MDLFAVGKDGHVWSTFYGQFPGRVVITGDVASYDSGPLTTPGGLTLDGSAHIVVDQKGDVTFTCHAHDSGFDNIDYTVSVVIIVPEDGAPQAVTYQHSGHVEGTIAGLPFGKPNRDDDPTISGTNAEVTNLWQSIPGSFMTASIAGTDTLVNGLEGALSDLLKAALQQAGAAAAKGVISLL